MDNIKEIVFYFKCSKAVSVPVEFIYMMALQGIQKTVALQGTELMELDFVEETRFSFHEDAEKYAETLRKDTRKAFDKIPLFERLMNVRDLLAIDIVAFNGDNHDYYIKWEHEKNECNPLQNGEYSDFNGEKMFCLLIGRNLDKDEKEK